MNDIAVFVNLEVITRDDALENVRGGSDLYDATGRPAKATLIVILDPVHLVWIVAIDYLLYH